MSAGTIVSTPIETEPDQFFSVNCDATGGDIDVEVLDEADSPLTGYGGTLTDEHIGARFELPPYRNVKLSFTLASGAVLYSYSVPAVALAPQAPVLLEPTYTDVDAHLALDPAFVPHPDYPDDAHVSTIWQIAADADTAFSDPIVNVESVSDLTAHLADDVLTASTAYRARALVKGLDGELSEPSNVVTFTTAPPLPTPEDPVLSDPPTNIEEDEVTLTVSDFEHTEGETTAENYPTIDLPFAFARRWQITTNADTGFASPVHDTGLNANIDLERTFPGLTASTTYRARTLVQDGKYGTLSDWSNVVVFTTDATPVDRPAQPTITATCTGRGATLAATAFVPFGAETHVLTQWRARPEIDSANGQDSFQTAVFLTSFNGWTALPAGTWLFDVRYKGSNGKWSLYSVADTCVVYDRPPAPVIESPVSGKVISASQLITITMPPVIDVDWNFVWQARQEGGSFVEVQNSDDLTYTFPILGKNNGFWEVRVQACYPTGHDAEGVCSDWATLKLRLDRTGIRAVSYSFVGLNDPSEIPGDPLLIWDNEDNDVTAELVDADLLSEGPSVGILMRNNQALATRQAVLALRALGQPVAGRFTTQLSIVPRERGVWWGWKWSQTHFMRAGIGYRAVGTGATDRSGLQLVARSGIQPYQFYPQTTEGVGERGNCICSFPGADPSCSWCIVNGTPCEPCTTCKGMPTSCSCVSAAADVARRSRLGSGGVLYEYGTSYGRGGIERFGRVQGSGGLQFYSNATLMEDGGLARGLSVSTTIADPDTGDCNWWFTRYTMEVDVAREGSQWRVKARLLGPGMDPDAWTQNELLSLGDTGGSMPCGYCGPALYHIASNLTDDYGILFHSFAASDLEYEDCEAPTEEITGCVADWRFTMFEDDDVTPWYGTYSGDFLTGSVGEADFYDNRDCPRPFLMPPKDFSETEIDYPAGASTIGQIRVGVLDKRLERFDQDTGIVTAKLRDAIGRRGVLERWRDDLGYVTVFDGVVESVEMDQEVVVWWFNMRDPREREREVELFSRNETFALYPEDGPIEAYGQLPNDQGYLLSPAQPQDAAEYAHLSPSIGQDGVHFGVAILSERTEEYLRDAVFPWGAVTYNGTTQRYGFRDITVRWRPSAGGDWTYLRNMPSGFFAAAGKLVTNAIIPPGEEGGQWRVFMSSTDPDDLPSNTPAEEVLIDLQILAARTTEKTPYFYDRGTAGELLLQTYQGEFVDAETPPRIRYNEERLEEWGEETPRMRFIAYKPEKMREWVERNIFAAIGWAPSFDENMRIIPSEWELPPSDEELVELDSDWVVPVGNFSDSKDSVVNRVRYTYTRESVLPALSGGFGTAIQIALRGLYGDSAWTRLQEEKVTREYVFEPSLFMGMNTIEYEPTTIRSFGGLEEAFLGSVFGLETADVIADKIGNNVIARFGWGAAEYTADVRSGMAHGPGFDPKTLDLVVGQWVIATVDWLPEYSIGQRNMRRYMQIKSITDPEIHIRRLRLIDGGPVMIGEEGESDEGEEDVLPSPTLGALSETDDLRVEIPVFLPTNAPADYRVRVDFAVSASEPAATSGLWTLVGYVTSDGSLFTPVLPADATVWVRARGELAGRRPTPWTDSETITLADTPALTFLQAVFVGTSGLVQLNWTPNDFCGGLEVEVSTGAIGHTPSYGPFDEVDADDLTLNLTGEEIAYGEELYARVTAWETFSLGSVGGTEGLQYVRRITRPEPADSSDHALGDHTDARFVPPEDRVEGMAPVWRTTESAEGDYFELVEVATLPIDLTTDVTGELPAANAGVVPGGTTGQVLKKQSNTDFDYDWDTDSTGSGGYSEGTSFPGSPSTNDKFYRTDRNILYFYDGTRWLSTQLFTLTLHMTSALTNSMTATSTTFLRSQNPWCGIYDLWAEHVAWSWNYSATASWTLALNKQDAATTTSIATHNPSFVNATDFFSTTTAIGAVVASTVEYFSGGATENTNAVTFTIGGIAVVYRLIG